MSVVNAFKVDSLVIQRNEIIVLKQIDIKEEHIIYITKKSFLTKSKKIIFVLKIMIFCFIKKHIGDCHNNNKDTRKDKWIKRH